MPRPKTPLRPKKKKRDIHLQMIEPRAKELDRLCYQYDLPRGKMVEKLLEERSSAQ